MAGGEEPRDPIDRWSEIIAVSLFGHAGVHGHPDTHLVALRPWLSVEAVLGRHCSDECVWSPGEGSTKSIAYRLEYASTVRSDGFPHDGIVAGECLRHRTLVRFPALGAALDVGKEERYGSGGKLPHVRTFALI